MLEGKKGERKLNLTFRTCTTPDLGLGLGSGAEVSSVVWEVGETTDYLSLKTESSVRALLRLRNNDSFYCALAEGKLEGLDGAKGSRPTCSATTAFLWHPN